MYTIDPARADCGDPLRALSRSASVLLILILVLAGLLRTHHLTTESLWRDEIYTYMSATGFQFRAYAANPENVLIEYPQPLVDTAHPRPWWTVLHPDTQDIHPPFYFFVVRVWASIFGWSEFSVRFLSVLAGVAATGFLFATVRELGGSNASALLAAAIIAIAQPQVRIAQDARSYALVSAMALAAAWTATRIARLGPNRRRIVALALLSLLMSLTHYFSVFVPLSLALWALISLRGSRRRAVVGSVLGALTVFALVWAPVLYLQSHGISGGGTTTWQESKPDHIHQCFRRLALWSVSALFTPLPNEQNIGMFFSLMYLLPLFMLRRSPALLLWVIWVPMNVLPTLLIDLTHHSESLEIPRYTILGTLGIYGMIAGIGATLSPRLRYALPVIALLGCILHADQAYTLWDHRRDQRWKQLASYYNTMAKPGDLTFYASSLPPYYDRMFHLCVSSYAKPFPGPIALIHDPVPPDVIAIARARRDGFIVVGDLASASALFPTARVTDTHQILFVGAVSRLVLPAPAASPQETSSSTYGKPLTSRK